MLKHKKSIVIKQYSISSKYLRAYELTSMVKVKIVWRKCFVEKKLVIGYIKN